MSDDAPQPPPSAPRRGVREAIVHAGVVAAAWALGLLGTRLVLAVVDGDWTSFELGGLLNLGRWAGVVGVAAALAAHRRPSCSRRRAALECAGIALVAWNAFFALWLGSRVVAEVMRGGEATSTFSENALPIYLRSINSPRSYVHVAGLALGLYLAAGRRGTRWEGLALSLPCAVFPMGAATFLPVPIVAVALPLLSRAVDRYFARRAAKA